MRQDNTIYKLSFSSKGQNKSKLQKQISNILISTVMAAWYNDRNDVKDDDVIRGHHMGEKEKERRKKKEGVV